MKLFVDGIGVLGPGIPDWTVGRAILAGRIAYCPSELVLTASDVLPAAERRRATATVKLAIAVCSEAMRHASASPEHTPSVFASSGGDGATITAILEILAAEPREVSPIRFHNSVHNAPSGYWGIATQSRAASISLCAYEWSFAAGFLEAACQALTERRPVLSAAYDLTYPAPLHAVRPIPHGLGSALVLSPHRTARSLACLSVGLVRDARATTPMADPECERLRVGNPAARSLSLLAAVARSSETEVLIEHVAGNALAIDVVPLPERAA